MERELKTVEMVIDDENENGVNALSLVTTPANEDETILLSKQSQEVNLSDLMNDINMVELAEVNNEEQLIMGLILSPDVLIYRRNAKTKEEYNITFSKETVKKAAHLYMKNLNNNNATVEHTKDKISGVTLVETWMVRDSKNDTSNTFGKEYNTGSWVGILKVHEKDKWEEYKNNGTTNISLEGVFTPKEVETKLSATDKLNYLKSIVNKK
jgi:hypothetical protein